MDSFFGFKIRFKIFLLLFLPLGFLSCSGWDDDAEFVPMPDKMFLFTDKNELHVWQGERLHPHSTLPYQNLQITDGDKNDNTGNALLLCTHEGLFRLEAHSLQPEKITPALSFRPQYIACGTEYNFIASDRSDLYFTEKKDPSKVVHTLNGYANISGMYYHAGKFIVVFDGNKVALFSEKALTELYRTEVKDTIRQMMPDPYHRIWITSSKANSDTLWASTIDLNANVAGSKNTPYLAKQMLFTPYLQRPYEREYLQDLTLNPNGTVSGTDITPRVGSIAADFDASRLYAEKDSVWLMYDLQKKSVIASYPKINDGGKIRKGITVMRRKN